MTSTTKGYDEFSTLDHVVLDFARRTIELHGYDGEVVVEKCSFDKKGLTQFQNMVEYCQEHLTPEQRIYKL
jgi:hypothetical protein